jgi:hypothetical protein
MKKSSYSFLVVLFVGVVSMTACTKDMTKTIYNGPDVVEFANPATGTLTRTLTVPTGGTLADSILVQLVAPQRTTATNVNFTIDAASTILSSEYTVTSPSPVSIAASSSSTWVKFRFNKPPASRTLIVTLTGGDNVGASVNWRTFTYTIR